MRLGGTRRDDANNFFIVVFIKRVHDQEHRTRSNGPNRYPALLIVKGGVTLGHRVRIVENELCCFKANIVLAVVLPVLVLVPIKTHRPQPLQNIRKSPCVSIY